MYPSWALLWTLLLLLLSRFSHVRLCNPIDGSSPSLHRPWDSPGKNTGRGCHFPLQCMKVKSESEVAQSCPTLSDPMDCSLPGSSIHGIFQARVLEWGAIAFSTPLNALCTNGSPSSLAWRNSNNVWAWGLFILQLLRSASEVVLFLFHGFLSYAFADWYFVKTGRNPYTSFSGSFSVELCSPQYSVPQISSCQNLISVSLIQEDVKLFVSQSKNCPRRET